VGRLGRTTRSFDENADIFDVRMNLHGSYAVISSQNAQFRSDAVGRGSDAV